MTLLLIMVSAAHADDVARLLDQFGVQGYSEIPEVLGRGRAGRKLGTRAFPGSTTVFLVAVGKDEEAQLVPALRQLRETRGPEEGLKVYSFDTTEVL